MKYSVLLLLLFVSFFASGQYHFDKNDFFEVQGNYATFAQNKFDVFPNRMRGEQVSGTGSLIGYGIGMRYGKGITSNVHLIFGATFSRREEAILTDFLLFEEENRFSANTQIEALNSWIVEFGPRIKVVNMEHFEISAGGGGFAKLTPKSANSFLAGYYAHGIVGINFNQRVQVNVKYGFETTEGRFRNSSFPIELAYHCKIY